ncbi:anaerobic sulfatase maturase [Bacteroidota bacterium]
MKTFDSFHLLAKPTGPICNLDCHYCFYLEKEKLYENTNIWAMSDKVLEHYIKQYLETQNTPVITFAWQGGEPTLLGVDFFKRAIDFQNKYSNGKKIENTFQTNGVLLDDEWCDFFAENNVLIGLSIDGPSEIHDKFRVYKGGQPSFEKVMKGLEFLKKHNVEFNTLTCVQKDNSYRPLHVYNFLKEIGSRFMQFIPIVERKAVDINSSELELVFPSYPNAAMVTDWSVEPLKYGEFLTTIFDEWIRQDVGEYFVQIFDIALEIWYQKKSSLCVFKETCGEAMAIEHNGDIYSCDHYVYPEYRLGNILEEQMDKIVNSSQQVSFGKGKLMSLPEFCLQCDVRFACNGECPKHRFINSPDGESGLNYLCAGYKHFFNYIDLYMKFMANELYHQRPPANVMERAKLKDEGFPGFNVGRNDNCPCGSGKKYKKCCGKLK